MNDVVHDAVGEVALLRVGLVHPERQHGDRRSRLSTDRLLADQPGGCRLGTKREDSDRTSHVAQLQVAEIDHAYALVAAHLLGDRARNDDPTWLGVGLQPGGHVHPVAVDVILLDDDVRHVDGHSEADSPIHRLLGRARSHLPL